MPKTTLNGLKKYLKENSLDDNLQFIKFEKLKNCNRLWAKLDNGQKVFWNINDDFTLSSAWYYTEDQAK